MKDFPRNFLKSVFKRALETDTAPRRYHITRFEMYHRLKDALGDLSASSNCLSISGSEQLCSALGVEGKVITKGAYPDVDCTSLPYPDGSFDLYVSDQVLEHVRGNPSLVFAEAKRVVRPGGMLIITTCLINPVHAHPDDFWRFTENGLRFLAEQEELEIVTSGAWGNRLIWPYIRLGLRMELIPENPNNPIYQIATMNEADVPISTWIAARR